MTNLRSILTVTMAIAVAVLSMGCDKAQKQNNNPTAPEMENANGNVKSDQTGTTKAEAQQILTAYLEVKDALVKTNGDAASAAATKLLASLGENKDQLIEKIRSDAAHIAKTKEVSHQRDHFNTLSEHVYTIVKAKNANETPLYRQYCPMAMNDKGAYWLSAEEEIRNPYFGDKMLKCGVVKETLK